MSLTGVAAEDGRAWVGDVGDDLLGSGVEPLDRGAFLMSQRAVLDSRHVIANNVDQLAASRRTATLQIS